MRRKIKPHVWILPRRCTGPWAPNPWINASSRPPKHRHNADALPDVADESASFRPVSLTSGGRAANAETLQVRVCGPERAPGARS
jgi:hypothetical protein